MRAFLISIIPTQAPTYAASEKAPKPARPPPPSVRPLAERARDYAIVSGASGAFIGACVATRQHISAFRGALFVGSCSAALACTFIGLRHAILMGDFTQDREAVSGLAAGVMAFATRFVIAGPQAGAVAGGMFFVGGCAAHHAHRWWLLWRLTESSDKMYTL